MKVSGSSLGIPTGIVDEMKGKLAGKMNGTAAPAAKQSPSSPNKGGTLGGLSNFKAPDGAQAPRRNAAALPSKAKDVGAEAAAAALHAGGHLAPPGPASAVLHAAGDVAAHMAAAAPGAPGDGGNPVAEMRADQKQAIRDQAEMAKIQREGTLKASMISQQTDLFNALVKQMEKGTKQIAQAISGQ
jgi:hypothetical protein